MNAELKALERALLAARKAGVKAARANQPRQAPAQLPYARWSEWLLGYDAECAARSNRKVTPSGAGTAP